MAQQQICMNEGAAAMRNSGLDVLGSVPWGAHMCLFYETKADLLTTLVPYFAAGLADNECCFWVTSNLLSVEEAAAALRDAVPDLNRAIANGQMIITEYTKFFLREGRFDVDDVMRKWKNAFEDAMSKGFVGVRASGDTLWLKREDWGEFMRCEVEFERMFGDAPVLLLCTYNTEKFDASEGQDVANKHGVVLTRTHARWRVARNASGGGEIGGAHLWATPMGEGWAIHQVVTDETGSLRDFKFLDVNPGFERITSLRRADVCGKLVSEVLPELEPSWIDAWLRVATTGHPARCDVYIDRFGRWYDVSTYQTKPGQVATQLRDITERKRAEGALKWRERRNELLADAAALLLRSTHPQSIIEALCGKVMMFLDCQVFFNYLVDESAGRLHLNACGGISSEDRHSIEWLEYGVALCGSVARDGAPVVINDLLNVADPRSAFAKSLGVKAYCGAPLLAHGKVTGTLAFGARNRTHFTQNEIEVVDTVAGLIAMAINRVKTEEALRQSQQDLMHAQVVGAIGSWRYDLRQDVVTWTDETYRIFGVPLGAPLSHKLFLDHVHPDDRSDVERSWQKVLAGAPDDIEFRIIAGGEEKWVRGRAVLEFDVSGVVTAVFGVTQDITRRKRREAQIQLLLREVNHRAKNMLTLVQAIAWQTAASASKDFVERFSERIQALAASQDLLVKSEWRGVDMEALARSQLAHFSDQIGTKILLDGPKLRLTTAASQSIGMALHELATNAGKYGALSCSEGRVAISWKIACGQTDMEFIVTWIESGGPAVVPPSRRGFGHTVIVVAPQLELGANIHLDYAPEGLRWKMVCPAVKVLDRANLSRLTQCSIDV